jgi:hypothetical protein
MVSTKSITQHYECLTPQERFQLILAASGRNDEAERERLLKAGDRINLSMPAHAPYAMAFSEVSYLTFMELVEDAARFFDATDGAKDLAGKFNVPDPSSDDPDETTIINKAHSSSGPQHKSVENAVSFEEWRRTFDIVLALGYILRTKAEGWELFCKRMSVPPFLLWEGFPGNARLKHALATVKRVAFTSQRFLRWINSKRKKSKPLLTAVPLSTDYVAKENANALQIRANWWGT